MPKSLKNQKIKITNGLLPTSTCGEKSVIKLQNIETIKQLNLDSNSGYDTISPTISDSVSKILNKIKKTEMKNFNT